MPQARSVQPTPIITLIGDACREVLANRESLPSMPDVAIRVHEAMKSPNWSINTVASIIKGDPGTTTYLLQIANSALYSSVSQITEVEIAVARIGMDDTRNLVMAHALKSMFVTNSPFLDSLMRENWRTSARLAALSAVLARSCPNFSPERALLAGLLQDIGVLPILNVLKRFESQLTNEAQVKQAIERYAAQVGMVLLKQWGFEPEMVEVARSRCDWHRDPKPTADLADLVLIARLHGDIIWGNAADHPKIGEIPAASKLPLGELREDSSLECLHEDEASVLEVMRLLGAEQSID